MANSNAYNLRSKGGLIDETKGTQELKDEQLQEGSTGSGSDPDDYTIDYSRIDALRSGIANLGQNHIDLVNSNVNQKNDGKIASIEYAIADKQVLLENLVKNAQEVEAARIKREIRYASRTEEQEDPHPSVGEVGLFGDTTIGMSNEERRFLNYLEPNPDHIVKPDKEDTYRDDEYVEHRLDDRPILPKWDELDNDNKKNQPEERRENSQYRVRDSG
jgi:hypothetical protein